MASSKFTFEFYASEIENLILRVPTTFEQRLDLVRQMNVHLGTCEWFYTNAGLLGLDADFLDLKLRYLHYIVDLFAFVQPVQIVAPPRRPNLPRPPPRLLITNGEERRMVNGIAARPDKRKNELVDEDEEDEELQLSRLMRKRFRVLTV